MSMVERKRPPSNSAASSSHSAASSSRSVTAKPSRSRRSDRSAQSSVSGESMPVKRSGARFREPRGSPAGADEEMVTKALLYAAGTAIVLLFFSAAITAEPGLDYFIDAGTPIDALARGDWREFYANQPLMGSFSLFLRAPFVAAVYHQSASMVYVIGSVPVIAAMVALAAWLLRKMQREGRSEAERAMV